MLRFFGSVLEYCTAKAHHQKAPSYCSVNLTTLTSSFNGSSTPPQHHLKDYTMFSVQTREYCRENFVFKFSKEKADVTSKRLTAEKYMVEKC